jgi:hypothetical protein
VISNLINLSLKQLIWQIKRRIMNQPPLIQFTDQHPCVFTLSTGRAGTRTLASLLSLSTATLSYHEPKPLLYGLSQLSYLYGNKSCSDFIKEAFLIARKFHLDCTLSSRKGYVETSPQATFIAPIIHNVVPGSKFVHIIRDPKDFIRSGMRRRWYVDHPMDTTRIKPPPGSKLSSEWQFWSPFRKIIWLWQETNLWIDQFINTLGNKNCLFLHAEEIFEAQFESIEKLFSFLNSSMPSKNRIKAILSKKMNAQTSGDFPKFNDWTNDMQAALIENAGKTAEYFGYRI